MKFPGFLRKKTTYVSLLLLVGGGYWVWYSRTHVPQIQYETVAVERKDIAQTVEVTGELKPAQRIDLAFRTNGTLDKVYAKIGQNVKQGELLAELRLNDVQFAVRSAQASLTTAEANLRSRRAGETSQSIHVAETQVEQAEASLDKAVADLASSKQTTQDALQASDIALQAVTNNLNNQNAIVTQNVQNAYDSARTTLLTALGPMTSALSDGDQITGVDNTAANQTYLNVLGILDTGSMSRAKASYVLAKNARTDAEAAVKVLSTNSTQQDIQTAVSKTQTAIAEIQTYLTDVQKVLAASLTSSSFTETTLATKRTTIDADRTSVSAQNTTVLSAQQTMKGTELTKQQTMQQLQDAYRTALTTHATAATNAIVQVRSAETAIAIQKAGLSSALATLNLKKNGPRAVDLEPLEAAVEQARVTLEKAKSDIQNAQITAPVDGTISDILPDVGEQIVMNGVAIKMVGTEHFDIEAQVPESDVAKIEVGQTAMITLDAYGDDTAFTGIVSAKDPAETKVQEAVYYKIRIQIQPNGKELKPGMTANVTIKTAERKQVLMIPLRAVRTKEDGQSKIVRILKDQTPEERSIQLGLKGDEGRAEILSGLAEGELVIVGETAPQ